MATSNTKRAGIASRRRARAGRAFAPTVQLRERGVVTIPKAVRDRYGLGAGDAMSFLDLDGVFVLSPKGAVVPELAAEIERLRVEAGYTTEELLESLRAERERSAQERSGEADG
ncbi:MAG: AbrB/MazE/SpoVT family DNA-binding domain-containing protein [Bacteroidota bacterium]